MKCYCKLNIKRNAEKYYDLHVCMKDICNKFQHYHSNYQTIPCEDSSIKNSAAVAKQISEIIKFAIELNLQMKVFWLNRDAAMNLIGKNRNLSGEHAFQLEMCTTEW